MNIVNASGKRKRAVARATIRPGKGSVRINHMRLETMMPEMERMRIQEPLLIADKAAASMDIEVTVAGGGYASQAEAARLAIARAMVAYTKDQKLEKSFLDYDRHLIVADVRRKEVKKPNTNSKARAKKQKSYR